ncbi:Uncharacterized protein dnm_096010 [Desulfonema magnum]|uniref:Uncharacterized protein n=1 Tax=Desulfonema magnum TaxID=45655 RepID=A0A975BXJ8_9BACT|nr:Uncharacterized protein dnm_096010 [Desulfonema magnum]
MLPCQADSGREASALHSHAKRGNEIVDEIAKNFFRLLIMNDSPFTLLRVIYILSDQVLQTDFSQSVQKLFFNGYPDHFVIPDSVSNRL